MQFADKVKALAQRLPDVLAHLQTEEATKTALVMPFIASMGYDVFDPTEVVPEFIADVGIKKGEKVDYAIRREGEIIILIECKPVSAKLSIENASQLYRYFSVTKARIAILTNGVEYRFYSDLDEPNKLDGRPFLVLDLTALRDDLIAEVAKMTKAAFSLDEMLSSANQLKYLREIRNVLEAQLEEPDEEFVRFFYAKVTNGRFVQSARDQFTPLVKKALHQFISDRVGDRLRNALAHEDVAAGRSNAPPAATIEATSVESPDASGSADIVTTEEELEGFRIVRAIVCSELPAERVVQRDAKSYFAVLVDDNNRKPLCRLWFNTSQKYVGLLDETKAETRHPIASAAELYRFAEQLRTAARRYV